MFKEKYPELDELNTAEWAQNRTPYIVLATAIPKQNAGNKIKEKYIFKMFHVTPAAPNVEKKLWEKLKLLIEKIDRLGRQKIAIPMVEGLDITLQQKMLECLTRKLGIKVELYSPASYAAKTATGTRVTSTTNTTTAATGNQ